MKSTLKYGLLAAALAATLSSPAFAWRGHGHGGGHGWGWGGFAVGAAVTGLAFESAYLASYPSYAYAYPYTYAYPAPAPVYVQQTYTAPPPQAVTAPEANSGMWYFCRKSSAYYPYVRSCAAGWEQVPATPPR